MTKATRSSTVTSRSGSPSTAIRGLRKARGRGGHVSVANLDDAPVADYDGARTAQGGEGEGSDGVTHAGGYPPNESMSAGTKDQAGVAARIQPALALSARTSSPSVPRGAEQVVPRQR